MKRTIATLILTCASTSTAFAELPMGLKCEPTVKIVGAQIGEIGKYEVQKGMVKEQHSALLGRKEVKPVDGCHFPDITPKQVVVVRYGGPELGDTEVQCIDQNNNNAAVTFPKSIYTVRNSRIAQWMLMPYCPDGKSTDGFPCSKLDSQSQRSTEYQDTILKWKDKKGNDNKDKLHQVDLAFDPPYRDSVPSNAKLFCALINKAGNVVIAGTAQYPTVEAAPDPRARSRTAPTRGKPEPEAGSKE